MAVHRVVSWWFFSHNSYFKRLRVALTNLPQYGVHKDPVVEGTRPHEMIPLANLLRAILRVQSKITLDINNRISSRTSMWPKDVVPGRTSMATL
jgi:hypothetical protein